MTPQELTLRRAQTNQPWTVPYSPGVQEARNISVSHILGSHCALHAVKTVGKLASVFEALDHTDMPITAEQRSIVASMSADLVTEALRFANLYDFDLARAFVERVAEKNGVNILDEPV